MWPSPSHVYGYFVWCPSVRVGTLMVLALTGRECEHPSEQYVSKHAGSMGVILISSTEYVLGAPYRLIEPLAAGVGVFPFGPAAASEGKRSGREKEPLDRIV